MQSAGRTVTHLMICTVLLAGCASTLSTRVTRFNQWPADAAGTTYAFTATDPQRRLELQAYQHLVGAELQHLGLHQAPVGTTARFTVDIQASLIEKQRQQQVPVYGEPWAYTAPWRDPYGRVWGGHWVTDPWWPGYVGERTVTQTLQQSQFRLRIREGGSGDSARTVFEATAVHEGDDSDLVEVMPYLVRGVFQDFPGANGQVRRLSFDLPRQ